MGDEEVLAEGENKVMKCTRHKNKTGLLWKRMGTIKRGGGEQGRYENKV